MTFVVIGLSAVGAENSLEGSIQSLAQSLTRDLQTRGVKKLAAIDFIDIRGYRTALDAFIAEELVTQVMVNAPGKFTFVERRQLGRILEEQKLNASAVFDDTTLANVGKILGLDAVITGSISDLGTQIRINARAVAVQTGEVFSSASVSVSKDGPVAELLRQNGRPESDSPSTASSGPTRRPVQATDVFFENRLVRLTVASAGMSPDKHSIALSLQLENRSNTDLLLALPAIDGSGGCGMAISDGQGNLLRVQNFDLAGIPCIYQFSEKKPDAYASVAPRSRTNIVAKVSSQKPAGDLLSVAIEFITLSADRVSRFSAGLSNIEVH